MHKDMSDIQLPDQKCNVEASAAHQLLLDVSTLVYGTGDPSETRAIPAECSPEGPHPGCQECTA